MKKLLLGFLLLGLLLPATTKTDQFNLSYWLQKPVSATGIGTTPLINYERYVDIGRTDTYTADGTAIKPYKSILAALTAVNADVGKSWVLHIASGTYADNLTITGPRYLKIESAGGVVISGTILINSGVGAYDRIEFVGTNGGRAEKGPALTLSGKITAERANDSLIYVGFHGCVIGGQFEATTSGTWVLQYENCRVNGAITGTLAVNTQLDNTILIEAYGFNEFVGTVSGIVSFYNCNGADLYCTINTTPWFENRFTHTSFNGTTTIAPQAGAPAGNKVVYVDSYSYKSAIAKPVTLTGAAYSGTDGNFPGTLTASNLTATPKLSNEVLTNVAGWTDPDGAGGWSYGTPTAGVWNHATGVITALTATGETAIAIGTKYEIVMTLTTSVAGGGLAVSLGGQSFAAVSATGTYTFNVTALSTAALAITPTSGTWVGSLTISVKLVTNGQLNAEGITLNSGQLLLPNGNDTYPSISGSKYPSQGLYFDSVGSPVLKGTSGVVFYVAAKSVVISGSGLFIDDRFLAFGVSNDLLLYRDAAATLQMGTDAVAPVAQTLKACDVTAGTADTAGGTLTIASGNSTGANNGTGYLNSPLVGTPGATTVNTTAVRASWNERGLTTYNGFNVNLVADAVMQMGQVVMADAGTDGLFDVNGANGTSGIGVLRGVGPSAQGTAYDIAIGGLAYVAMAEDQAATRNYFLIQSATAGFCNNSATVHSDGLNIGVSLYSEALFAFTAPGGVTTNTITLNSAPGWAVNDPVIYWQSGDATVPTGLTTGTVYWIRSITTRAITLSATRGGAVLAITANTGSGTTMYFQRLPKAMINLEYSHL
jgi:hypothetical protein